MNKPNLSLIPLFLFAATAAATTRYVVPPGTPGVATAPGYTSWGTAATNIQHAVDAAATDDLIFVTNGTYYLTSEISIAKKITLRSFKDGATDRDGTILDGNFPATSNRCLNVNFAGAVVDGFTITNGCPEPTSLSGNGGGIHLSNGIVTNCLIVSNRTLGGGGGIYLNDGGIVVDSTISGNVATNANNNYGGGIYFHRSGLVTNCLVKGNLANFGGGVYFNGLNGKGGLLIDSDVIANECHVRASGQGQGGIGMYFKGFVTHCNVVSNKLTVFKGSGYHAGVAVSYYAEVRDSYIAYNTGASYGGGLQCAGGGSGPAFVTNCVVMHNQANIGGGVYLGQQGLLVDCTVVSNSSAAYVQGGTARNCLFSDNTSGVWNNKGFPGTYQNCTIANNGGVGIQFSQPGYVENYIVYNNNSGGVNWSYDGTGSGSTWTNSCTYPMPTGASVVGMETNAPRFMNAALGDFSLRGSSPCIDKGVYRTWMASAKDRAGNPRIIGAAVDMGAFEAPLPPGTAIVVR